MTFAETVAIIGGSGGLSAVLNFAITQWTTRSTRDRDKTHQLMLVVEHLENYAFGCAGHAFSDWAVLADGRQGALLSQPPFFPSYSDKIDWRALESAHAVAARKLPYNVELALAAVAAGFDKSSFHGYSTALFWTLRLGAEALELSAFLRQYGGIEELVIDYPRWPFPVFLSGEMKKIDLRKEQIAQYLQGNS